MHMWAMGKVFSNVFFTHTHTRYSETELPHMFKQPIRVRLSFGSKMSYVLLCSPVLYVKHMKYLAWIIR